MFALPRPFAASGSQVVAFAPFAEIAPIISGARQVTTPNNLPAELTSFVGRGPQLAELRRLMHRSRLITLTGPGGAGKSRLALRLAGEVLDRYPDGVWLVDLAALVDERLLEHTVASVGGVKEDSRRPVIEAIADTLAKNRCLILLDGCEHLVDSCAAMTSRLLRSCPRLTVIATSREPLGVSGEVTWRTPSLTIPKLEDSAHPELLMESEAIRLFVDRARLSRPEFELEPGLAAAVAQVCTRLEGIPLAIELAAGLASVMTLEEILERLQHRFQLLTGGGRTSLPRHQTLRQAVDWSYGLLGPTEQALFARLGIFAGGFDLVAAEAVVSGSPIEVADVQPLLSRLVHKSLVVAEPTHPVIARYRMLDTIREYALEKLDQIGEWRRRHADYFSQWTANATQNLTSVEQGPWLRRMEEEQANIRLALEWSVSVQSDDALRLAGAMGGFWAMRRNLAEGFEWLSRALEVETSTPELRANPLIVRARLSHGRGDYATAEHDAEEAVAIARAREMYAELTRGLTILGMLASHRGDLVSAHRLFAEVEKLATEHGDHERLASSLNNLALIESTLGQHDAALAHAEKALLTAENIGHYQRAIVRDTVARINLRLGNREAARRHYSEALSMSAEVNDPMNIADALEGMGLLSQLANDSERTVVLLAAAEAIRSRTGSERTPEWAHQVNESMGRAKGRLAGGAFETAHQRGGAMSMEEAIRFALGERRDDHRDGKSRLTDREIEVARLIVSGLTNGEAAAKLRISERTVDAHVEHIRNKLGLRTRAQIAVWAHERLGDA